jgi:uncharacterized protein
MPVGICYIQFRIVSAGSLKDKRRVVKSLKDRLKNRFNISIAETGRLNSWRDGELGFTCISNDHSYLEGMMSGVVRMVESDTRIVLTDIHTEVV